MAPVRTNPLSPGVYQIAFAPELAPHFGKWRRAQKGKVHVLELEDGPGGTAQVSFAVFGRPGAFPFGTLGYPEQGAIVGALPDWVDVVSFIMDPLAGVASFLGREFGEALAHQVDLNSPELAQLREVVAQIKVNIATVERDLEDVRSGRAPNPAVVLHNAAALVKHSIEIILLAADHVPQAAKGVVNELLSKLHDLGEAIKSAPGRAIHAVTDFGKGAFNKVVKPFVLPYELTLLGLGVAALGGYLAFEEGHTTPLTRNLMLGGGAVAILGGGTLFSNISDLFSSEPTT